MREIPSRMNWDMGSTMRLLDRAQLNKGVIHHHNERSGFKGELAVAVVTQNFN